jgi:GST-like protein
MASYPWVVPHEAQGQNLADFPHLRRWFEAIKSRPATVRAYELAKNFDTNPVMTEERRKILFGQSSASLEPK